MEWHTRWDNTKSTLLMSDPSFRIWIDWYERRIRGERSSFRIPGDKRRKEDKWLLGKIADATDEEFWDHGPEFVNSKLAQWLEEARERASKNITMMSDGLPRDSREDDREKNDFQIPLAPGGRTYGPNAKGLLDRLPPDQQDQLRDNPNQRRSYHHIRDDLEELLGEGQRLGPKLQKLLQRALADFPEDFADAEADIIWRHIGKLRRAYRKHLTAVQNAEFYEDKLDQQIAIDLDGVLGLMNNFVFGDQGLIRRQENSVDPQLRPDRAEEAKAAEPWVEALTASEGVATETVKDDLRKGQDDLADALPSAEKGDPSADAEVDAINGERRNIFAGLLTGAKDTAKEIRSGAEKEVGKQGLTFVQRNYEAIIAFARRAYSPETFQAIRDFFAPFIGGGG